MEQQTQRYEVTGFTKTGFYSHVVEAINKDEALKLAKPILKEMAIGKIDRYRVDLD